MSSRGAWRHADEWRSAHRAEVGGVRKAAAASCVFIVAISLRAAFDRLLRDDDSDANSGGGDGGDGGDGSDAFWHEAQTQQRRSPPFLAVCLRLVLTSIVAVCSIDDQLAKAKK